MKSGVFIERDGILNLVRIERQHQVTPRSIEEFQPNPAAVNPLKKLKAQGFVLIATTNQPGVSRGYLNRRELDRMHDLLQRVFPLDGIMVCNHDDTDVCPCRKPRPGLFQEAAFRWHLDLERSYVVSDKWQDAHAAHLVGATSLLLPSPWHGSAHHDFVVPDLATMADKIKQIHSSPILAMDQV